MPSTDVSNWTGEIPERPEDFDGLAEFWAGVVCVLVVVLLVLIGVVAAGGPN